MMRVAMLLAGVALCVAAGGCTSSGDDPWTMKNTAPITLTAAKARIMGSDAMLEKTSKEEHIGWWERTNTFLQWTARDLKPGTYVVEALYALDPQFSGSTIATTVGSQTLMTKLEATKNWDDYHVLKLGVVQIDKQGDATLTVKVMEKPKLFVMNLQQVTLTPSGK